MTTRDSPKKWNCCDDLVTPKDLEEHLMNKYFTTLQR